MIFLVHSPVDVLVTDPIGQRHLDFGYDSQNPPLAQMDVLLTATPNQQAGRPGQTLAYQLTLKNTGAVVDDYIVTFTKGQFPIRVDAYGNKGPRQFELNPQEEVSFTIWVDLDEQLPFVWPDTVTVRAFNGYGIEAEMDLTIILDPVQESEGQVVLEAEHADLHLERSDRFWFIQDSVAGFVGDGYVNTFQDIDLQYGPDYATTSPELNYTINFATPGTYYVWLRGYSPNGAGDSVYVALDNQPAAILTGFAPGSWSWANGDTQAGVVSVEATQAGTHTLRLWQREDGLRLDRIVLTTDSGYTPDGEGPPESGSQ